MPMHDTDSLVELYLGHLEYREASLISWGLVDGFFTEKDLLTAAGTVLQENDGWDVFDSPRDLMKLARERALVLGFGIPPEVKYRTRMGETIRLLARLKQLFPDDMKQGKWRIAPNLVADFRFLLRRRHYPKRDVPGQEAAQRIEEGTSFDDVQKRVANAIIGTDTDRPLDLSEFQVRAACRIIADSDGSANRGTIVCAGTGSGKTLAFYLPAFVHIAERMSKSNRFTQCIAIYPRNELLKDQLLEALSQARKLDDILPRKLTVGAYFGDAPYGYYEQPDRITLSGADGWKRNENGSECPFLSCPSCRRPLLWRKEDIAQRHERLVCIPCGYKISHDEIVLTRDRMLEEPPDILFTTTEMVNQQISHSGCREIFGIGLSASRRPRLVLLDEVHTYEGVHGAQVASLIRRWRAAMKGKVHFVGLSATLMDAHTFFAGLIGLDSEHVVEVSQPANRMDDEGMEYLLALRSDPVSRTSLLSATIQTAMLLGRALDVSEEGDRLSNGFYGSKVFIFTDNLDIINRLYHNLRDAEGWMKDEGGHEFPLARLRNPQKNWSGERFAAGQSWDLCNRIGWRPEAQLVVERVSSQDPGVNRRASLVVATTSLEVGFNDPEVGAIIQHKAPIEEAQFIQRRGRAGRNRKMRPWTLVVLSDYGRDRIAYQSYDELFDPELKPRYLPVANRYVLRMQAVYALMDWLGSGFADHSRTSKRRSSPWIWKIFAGPSNKNADDSEVRKKIALIVREILEDDTDTRRKAFAYIERAIGIDTEELRAIMWEPPRAIMTTVLPTLLRRLETNWAIGGVPNRDIYISHHPLPEFVVRSLFSDLNLPEVRISVSHDMSGHGASEQESQNFMPVAQALREFAPGRISHRFGISRSSKRHWIRPPCLDEDDAKQKLSIPRYCARYDKLGEVRYIENGAVRSAMCYRPWELLVVKPPEEGIASSSNAFLDWRTQIYPIDNGAKVETPAIGGMNLIRELEFYTHGSYSHVEVRRFACASDATVSYTDGRVLTTRIEFASGEDEGAESAAVGFFIDVDGIAIRFPIPEELTGEAVLSNSDLLRSLRVQRFRHMAMSHPALVSSASVFTRERLCQLYLSSLLKAAMETRKSLREIIEDDGDLLDFDEVMNAVFQGTGSVEDQDEDSTSKRRQKTREELNQLLSSPDIMGALRECALILWSLPDESWQEWLIERFKCTVGAAFLEACFNLCPDLNISDLVLDIDAGVRPPGVPEPPIDMAEIWLTENTLGGGGIVEELQVRYHEDPRRFFQLFEGALASSDFEVQDRQLVRLLDHLAKGDNREIQSAVENVRESLGAGGHGGAGRMPLNTCLDEFKRTIARHSIFVNHQVVAAINARILRPGSSKETDVVLHKLVQKWKAEEERLGIEIDPMVFSYVESGNASLDAALARISFSREEADLRYWRFGVIYGLLWPRGSAIRNRELSTANYYVRLPQTERLLVEPFVRSTHRRVDVDDSSWREQLDSALATEGGAILASSSGSSVKIKERLLDLLVEPSEYGGHLLLHPRVAGVRSREMGTEVVIEFAEVL